MLLNVTSLIIVRTSHSFVTLLNDILLSSKPIFRDNFFLIFSIDIQLNPNGKAVKILFILYTSVIYNKTYDF